MCLLQSAVNDQMEETSSKELTEATLKEHRMQRILANIGVLGGGYVKAICLLAEKQTAAQFHSSALRFFFFFFFLFLMVTVAQFRKCGDAQLVRGCFAF